MGIGSRCNPPSLQDLHLTEEAVGQVVLEIPEPLLHVLGLVAVLDGHLEHLHEPLERVLVHRADVSQTLFFEKSI